MPEKNKLSLSKLPQLGQTVSQLLHTLQQLYSLYSELENSTKLHARMPAASSSQFLDLSRKIKEVLHIFHCQCQEELKASPTKEQQEAIEMIQNALHEIETLHASLVSIHFHPVAKSRATKDLNLMDIQQTLATLKKPPH